MSDINFLNEKLHLLPARELVDKRVSAASLWNDPVWFFDNLTAGQRRIRSTARWDYQMPEGSRFDDPRWNELRDANKRLLWSMLNDPRFRWRYKPGSIQSICMGLRTLSRFMAERNYANFGELDATAFEDYADYVVEQVRQRAGKAPNKKGDGLLETTLVQHLKAVSALVQQAPALAAAGLRMPADLPWGGMSAQEKARQLATAEKGKIPPIPDEVFCAAMNGALAALDGAEDIILEVLAFHAAFIDPSADKKPLRKKLDGHSSKSASRELRASAARLTEACVILLQGATGLRASEICGLDTSNEPASDWPACVKVQKSISGIHELFVIAGRLYKTTRSWVDVEWIVGARPVGSSHVPISVRAASVLDRLYRPWRTAQGVIDLFALFIPARGLPTRLVAGDNISLARAQRRHFEACGVAGWEVTTHQWRKTFAQYVMHTDDRLLPALKDHFKHLSIAMTENGYINTDPELRQLLDDARVQNTVNFIGDIITGRRKAYGPLAEHFEKVSKELGMRLGNRSDEERRTDIEDLVATSDIRLYSLGAGHGVYGNCLFRSGTARCAEGCVAKWAMRAPLWTAAQPDICWECANLVPDDTHKAFWIERLQMVRAALAAAVEDGNKAVELLCCRREAQSFMVLALMGVAPETINKETTDAA